MMVKIVKCQYQGQKTFKFQINVTLPNPGVNVLVMRLEVAKRHRADDVVGAERRPIATLDADLGLVEVDPDDLLSKQHTILDGVKLLGEHVLLHRVKFRHPKI